MNDALNENTTLH